MVLTPLHTVYEIGNTAVVEMSTFLPCYIKHYFLAGHTVDMAKQFGALLFGVEHRFYGKSVNEDGLELDQLQYLNSQQA